jgi:hypothetical protein
MTTERPPDGEELSDSIELDEPAREAKRSDRPTRGEQRPDLDARERRIREQRKPMGPPPREGERRREDRAAAPPTEPPTEPE